MTIGDFFAPLLDNVDTAAAGYLSATNVVAPLIREGLGAGYSANAIYNQLKGTPFGMRKQTFYGLVGELRAAAEPSRAGTLDALTGLPGEYHPMQLEGGRAGAYMVNVRNYYQQRDDLGNWERGYRTVSVIQYGNADVTQAILDASALHNSVKPGNTDTGTLIGQEVSGVYQWTG